MADAPQRRRPAIEDAPGWHYPVLSGHGDPRRFLTARALVKHAGLAPRENTSGKFTGRTKLTGQGRPGLRLAAWRAVWGTLKANPDLATHGTPRRSERLVAA